MTIESGYFPAVLLTPGDPSTADITYPITAWSELFHANFGYGVVPGYGSAMAVTAEPADPGTLRVRVASGWAWIDGIWVHISGSGETVDFDDPDATTRVDALVIRADLSARTGGLAVRKGDSASAPDLVNDANNREFRLRNVEIAPSDSNVRSAAITGSPPTAEPWWASRYAPLTSPDLSGSPTVGGQQILHTGLTPRVSYVDVDNTQPSETISTAGPAPLMILHTGFTIPSWATTMRAQVSVSGWLPLDDTSEFEMWLRVDGMANNELGRRQRFGFTTGKRDSTTFTVGRSIPASLRGLARPLLLQGGRVSGSGAIRRDTSTVASGVIQFQG